MACFAAHTLWQKGFGFIEIEIPLQRTAQGNYIAGHKLRQFAASIGIRVFDSNTRQVAAGVDDLTPMRSSLPIPAVGGIHSEYEQKPQQRTEHGVLCSVQAE